MAAGYKPVEVVRNALEELKNKKLIPDHEKHEQKITVALEKAAQKESSLTTQMSLIKDRNMGKVENEMSAIIGPVRVDLIKKSFTIETCKLKVVKTPDGKTAVHVYREGNQFKPEKMLSTIEDIEHVSALQWTSLVLEIFIFILSCVGIAVEINGPEMETLLKEIEELLKEVKFENSLNNFLLEWNAAGDSAWGKAKAIFVLLGDISSLGIFWKIIDLIFENMSILKKIQTIAEIAVMIVAAFATEGLALIARMALAVDGALHLEEKIVNLVKFSEKKKTF